jgi:predicted fused transcriptional regulator/phosphomethylpyrimidine kinase
MRVDWIHEVIVDFGEHGKEPSGSINCCEFLDKLRNY